MQRWVFIGCICADPTTDSEEEVEKPDGDENGSAVLSETQKALSVVEMLANREEKLKARRAAIASMSCAIIENPEQNVGQCHTASVVFDAVV